MLLSVTVTAVNARLFGLFKDKLEYEDGGSRLSAQLRSPVVRIALDPTDPARRRGILFAVLQFESGSFVLGPAHKEHGLGDCAVAFRATLRSATATPAELAALPLSEQGSETLRAYAPPPFDVERFFLEIAGGRKDLDRSRSSLPPFSDEELDQFAKLLERYLKTLQLDLALIPRRREGEGEPPPFEPTDVRMAVVHDYDEPRQSTFNYLMMTRGKKFPDEASSFSALVVPGSVDGTFAIAEPLLAEYLNAEVRRYLTSVSDPTYTWSWIVDYPDKTNSRYGRETVVEIREKVVVRDPESTTPRPGLRFQVEDTVEWDYKIKYRDGTNVEKRMKLGSRKHDLTIEVRSRLGGKIGFGGVATKIGELGESKEFERWKEITIGETDPPSHTGDAFNFTIFKLDEALAAGVVTRLGDPKLAEVAPPFAFPGKKVFELGAVRVSGSGANRHVLFDLSYRS